MSEKPFGNKAEKATRPLQVIFADIWGPMQPTQEGFRYALLIVDEFTSFTWVYLLHHKAQAEEKLIEFNEMQERSVRMIQEIRTDRGGEFTSGSIKSYMAQRGVVMRHSPPYTPQYQGKVERMNRTVGEMAHSMRAAAQMPLELWGISWEAAVYLRNRCPTKSNIDQVTPYQMLYDKPPVLSHVKVFGARGEAFVQPQIRLKGQDKSTPGRVVGYDDVSRAYRFIPDGGKKFILVRSVKCDEWSVIDMNRGDNVRTHKEQDFEVIEEPYTGVDEIKLEICDGESDEKISERKPERLVKDERRLTRGQLRDKLRQQNVAMISTDNFGGEYHGRLGGVNMDIPKSIDMALSGTEAKSWKMAIEDELQSLEEAQVLSGPVRLPEGKRAIGLKFIFAKKMGMDGKIDRYKARMVVNSTKNDGLSDEMIYSPVVERSSLRVFLAAVATQKWILQQADIKTAFLHSVNPHLDYVRLPKQVVQHDNDRVRILLKALYGLRRASKAWSDTFNEWATSNGFCQSDTDPCIFYHSGLNVVMAVYVDDVLFAGEDQNSVDKSCELLQQKFESRVMGVPKYFLGMNVQYNRDDGIIKLSQTTYIETLIDKY
jgi:hypothetical protein